MLKCRHHWGEKTALKPKRETRGKLAMLTGKTERCISDETQIYSPLQWTPFISLPQED